MRARRIVAAVVLLAAFGLGRSVSAEPAHRWDRYRIVSGDAATVVVFAGDCLNGEDSADHLYQVRRDAHRIVFGCRRKGY